MKKTLALLIALLLTPLAQAETRRPEKLPLPLNAAEEGLGTRLPKDLARAVLIDMLGVPPGDRARISLVGAKAWRHRTHSYVAIACVAQQGPRASGKQECEQSGAEDMPPEIYVAVVELAPGGKPRLVAASGEVDRKTSWRSTKLPAMPRLADDDNNKLAIPERWQRFDLAPYKIRDDHDPAFGLRAAWFEGYAGGAGEFDALYLFEIDGERLRVILAEPMTVQQTIAGEWNRDGTRQHQEIDGKNILHVLTRETAGYHELMVENKDTKAFKAFNWAPSHHEYRSRH